MSEQVIVAKASDTEVTVTRTVVTEQVVSLKTLKQQKAAIEAQKARLTANINSQLALVNKAIEDALAQGVTEEKPIVKSTE